MQTNKQTYFTFDFKAAMAFETFFKASVIQFHSKAGVTRITTFKLL